MKKLITIILITFSSFAFAQNGIEAVEGDANVLTKSEYLYNVFFTRIQQRKKIFVSDSVLKLSGITKLEIDKTYNFQINMINGKPIVYYVTKAYTQNALDIRKAQEEISYILRPASW